MSAATLKHRLRLGLVRATRASILRATAGAAAGKLFVTGVRPVATFGQSAIGLFPKQRSTLLASARKVAGPAGVAPCPRILVQIRLGVNPPVQSQVAQIRLWWKLWRCAEDRAAVTKDWRAFRDASASPPEVNGSVRFPESGLPPSARLRSTQLLQVIRRQDRGSRHRATAHGAGSRARTAFTGTLAAQRTPQRRSGRSSQR